MVILGLADGTDPGAALVVDDELVAVHAGAPGELGVPWAAAAEVVERLGLAPKDVDLVAIAGRYTPPFAARQRPQLRARGADPFAATRAAGTRFQGWLRGTGLGAWDADRATEWFEGRLREQGYEPRRVVLVDLHKALASAAYRCQPRDDVLVLVAHPLGDGSLLSVHHGQAGQIDRLALDRGSTAAHLWLDRWFSVLGVADIAAFDTLADGGAVDSGAIEVLDRSLSLEDGRIVGRARPGIVLRSDTPWGALAALPAEHVAASVRAHLRGLVAGWMQGRVAQHGATDLAIAGSWADDPLLTAAVAEDPAVERVWAGPWVGGSGLAVGAALAVAGVAPELPEGRGPGESASGARIRDVAGSTASPVSVERLVAALASGGAVARFVGPAANTPDGGGGRSVVVRADDAPAVERVRLALGRPSGERPGLIALSGTVQVAHADKLAGPLRYGTVAAEAHGAVRRVAWASDPELVAVLTRLHETAGCSAVAVFPLGLGADRPAGDPAAAVRVWERARVGLLELGPHLLEVR